MLASKLPLILVALLVVIVLGFANSQLKAMRTRRERQFALRSGVFWTMAGLLIVTAFIIAPKIAMLAAVPGSLMLLSAYKAWAKVRDRIRAEEQAKLDPEKNMKRVN